MELTCFYKGISVSLFSEDTHISSQWKQKCCSWPLPAAVVHPPGYSGQDQLQGEQIAPTDSQEQKHTDVCI